MLCLNKKPGVGLPAVGPFPKELEAALPAFWLLPELLEAVLPEETRKKRKENFFYCVAYPMKVHKIFIIHSSGQVNRCVDTISYERDVNPLHGNERIWSAAHCMCIYCRHLCNCIRWVGKYPLISNLTQNKKVQNSVWKRCLIVLS